MAPRDAKDHWTLRPQDLPPEWILRREPRLRGLEENPCYRRFVQLRRRHGFFIAGPSDPQRWIGPNLLVEDVWLSGISPEQLAQAMGAARLHGDTPLALLGYLLLFLLLSLASLLPSPIGDYAGVTGMICGLILGELAFAPYASIHLRSLAVGRQLRPIAGFVVQVIIMLGIQLSFLLGMTQVAALIRTLATRVPYIPARMAFWALYSGTMLAIGFALSGAHGLWCWRRRDHVLDMHAERYRRLLAQKLSGLESAPAKITR